MPIRLQSATVPKSTGLDRDAAVLRKRQVDTKTFAWEGLRAPLGRGRPGLFTASIDWSVIWFRPVMYALLRSAGGKARTRGRHDWTCPGDTRRRRLGRVRRVPMKV